MQHSLTTRAFLSVVIFLLPRLIIADDDPQPDSIVRMPIVYADSMVIVVTREGAGAVRFVDAFEKGNELGNGLVGTLYEWRFLDRKEGAAEQTGKGRVFAKLVDGKVNHGSFVVKCGPVQMNWSHTNEKSATVIYDVTKLAVHPVAAQYFAETKGPGENVIKATDLSHFLYSDEESIKAHLEEVYDGPDRQRKWHTHQVSGSVPYGNCVIVVRDPHGVATFKFGDAFERQLENTERHIGVAYDYTFTSHDGTVTKAGRQEVFERYMNDKYNDGRLYAEAGPTHLSWSQGGKDRGWLYYDPMWIRVWYANEADAKKLVDAVRVTELMHQQRILVTPRVDQAK